MKICFVGLQNLPVLSSEFSHHGNGGEEVQQTLLAKALAKRGYEVSMVVGDYGQPDGKAWHGVTTYKAYRFDAGLPVFRFIHPRWTGIWAALKRANADVYYTSCAGMMLGLMAMFCSKYGRGLVFRLASNSDADPNALLIRYWRDKKLYDYGLRNSDEILSQHSEQQQMLLGNYGVSSQVADMLVDPPDRELCLADRDVSVLWVSNLREVKRPDLALEFARCMPQYTTHMVGGAVPGFIDLYESIQAQAAKLSNLKFHGRVPYHDVGDFYDRAKVFINTSDMEGFPNTYLQSWRRGVPVVAFFDPDGIIRREGLGMAVSSMDEMQGAVEHLLTDDDEWHRTSERCRAYMERMHGDDIVLKPYLAAFEVADRKRKLR